MLRPHPLLRRASHLVYIISVLFSLSLCLSAQVQSYRPYFTYYPGSTFVDGKALYVVGGTDATDTVVNQAFMIDLSVSWKTTSPVYKKLPPLNSCYWCPTAMSGDGQRLLSFWFGTGHAFVIQANMWTHFLTYDGDFGHAGATDPTTGKIFIPTFALSEDEKSGMMSMFIVDSNDYTSRVDDATAMWMRDWDKYAMAWNARLKKLLLVHMSRMYSYTPEEGWKNSTGPPGLRATDDFCMVSSSSGSKVVLFGGYSKSLNASLGDIFILDATTLTWKKGPPTPQNDNRRFPVCGLSNDQFIAWGGFNKRNTALAHDTLVYDLKTDEWVSEYTAPTANPTSTTPSGQGEPRPTDTPSSEGDTSSSESGTSDRTGLIGAIVGAFVGALAVGLAAGGIVEYRAHRRRSKAGSSSVATERKETVQ
ncbi:hypothetical protein BGX34_005846, partial [Mortierella sp. NVP85]